MTRHCEHTGLHSGVSRYSPQQGAIRFVVVCDTCGNECRELQREAYVPRYEPAPPEHQLLAA